MSAFAPRDAGLRWLEPVTVFVAVTLVYLAICPELPIDDTDRFTADIDQGLCRWDGTHLLMQPATVFWHKYFSFGSSALDSQKRINIFSTAVSMTVLTLSLRRWGVPPWQRAALVGIGLFSFNILQLGTSGHMKLTAMPFLTLALYYAVELERGLRDGSRRAEQVTNYCLAAAMLAAATLFLINSVLVVPFLCLSLFVSYRRSARQPLPRAAAAAIGFGVLCGTFILVAFSVIYLTIAPPPHELHGLKQFILADKSFRRRG